jgi:hypothetical protein
MPKLSIRCKGCAGTADKKGEADELDHLRKQIGSIRIELVGPALHQRPFSMAVIAYRLNRQGHSSVGLDAVQLRRVLSPPTRRR